MSQSSQKIFVMESQIDAAPIQRERNISMRGRSRKRGPRSIVAILRRSCKISHGAPVTATFGKSNVHAVTTAPIIAAEVSPVSHANSSPIHQHIYSCQ